MRTPHSEWWQATVAFPDPDTAEHTAAQHLAPALAGRDWFFVRKSAWRCRIRLPPDAAERAIARDQLTAHLDGLVAVGHLNGWVRGVYEPELRAFGGWEAMDVAHTLWCADTHHLMDFLSTASDGLDGRRELGILLCRVLLRAAGLDRYEQGDVWDKVAATRPLPTDRPALAEVFHHQMHRLLNVDPGPEAAHFTTGAFAGHATWACAFHTCGHTLAELATRGRLERGLRAVLAHHLLFSWNRIGLSAMEQAALSHAAATVIFDPETVNL